ncbi:MAG: tRNA preQ1(34) S-adenosylmethionine ribosyltransferase-isomerase QueA [Candidatus Omnitrophica bacterium]|nr:tRNA preQ1(34) S-adenosylmethionine ribosyltransferase-isomerase QueA [Candidatus Omnitrophota bacterium]
MSSKRQGPPKPAIPPHSLNKIFRLQSYFYHLPDEQIAQQPLRQRDKARLLIVNRAAATISHDTFDNLNAYLPVNSALVVNNSKVIPARLLGKRKTGGSVEVFLLNGLKDGHCFEALLRPLKKIREGEEIDFGHGITARLEDKTGRVVRFNTKDILRHLGRIGHVPLPPYVKRPDTPQDKEDYQTVYAKQPGSVACPTAGLHFTRGLIKDLKHHGHRFLEVTLHINYGTFKPVECADIRRHPMHSEYYDIKPAVYRNILKTKENSRPLVAVGTTSCRVLESVARSRSNTGHTDMFIYPGFKFRMVDALITNFHLPYSTLLMLVCALGGHDLVMKAYEAAVRERYRFYSYGDAMLIV